MRIFAIIPFVLIISLFAGLHSGRTDGSGGHYGDSSNEYHYHHGYPAHDHYDMNRDGTIDCPYEFDDKTNHSNNNVNNWNSENVSSKKITFKDIILIIFEIVCRLFVSFILTFLFSWGIMECIEKKTKNPLTEHTVDVIWKILFFSIAAIVTIVTVLIVLYSNEIL